MAEPADTYRILFAKGARKWRSRIPKGKHGIVEAFVHDHLAVKPLERIPGKTKQLKGAYKGILQYDIDAKSRIHYSVDRRKRVVRVLYIGPHPEW